MAIKESRNWVRNQRIDVTDLRALDQAAIYDAAMLLKCFQNQTPYILSGFNIPVTGITGPASSLQVVVDGAVAWIPNNRDGSYLKIDPGTANEVLSGTNTRVIGAFAPNQNNYLGVRFKRKADAATSDLVAIWDVDAQVEFNKTVPRGLVLDYEFVISSTDFGDTAPIAIIKTTLSNNVESITNAKQSMFRLGRGGATPNKSFNFEVSPDDENKLKATSPADPDPFQGGDWELETFKDWMDLVMTEIKKIKGSAYWYSQGSSAISNVNLTDLYNDALASVVTGKGRFKHDSPGLLQWSSEIYITSLIGIRKYTIEANPVGVTLADGEVLYTTLVRNEDFQPINTFSTTAGSQIINAAINVTGVVAGDYVKFESHPDSAWRKVSSVVGTVINLEGSGPVYPITATDEKLLRTKGDYLLADLQVAAKEDVPADANTYWLAYREDNAFSTLNVESILNSGATRAAGVATITTVLPHGLEEGMTVNIQGISDSSFDGIADVDSIVSPNSFTYQNSGLDVPAATAGGGTVASTARLYLRALGELAEGEERIINDNTTENILEYIGSPSESDKSPSYLSNIRGAALENLTQRMGVLTDAMGDAQEDRSAFLRSDEVVTWTGDQLEFTSDIVLEIINTKTGVLTEHVIEASNSPIVIGDGESIWVSIDRTDALETITVNNSGVTPIPAQTQANKDVFVLFKRIDSVTDSIKLLYIPLHKQLLTEGQTTRLGQAGGGNAQIKAKYLDPVSTTLPVGLSYLVDGQNAVDGDTVLFTNLSNPADNNRIYEISGVGVAIQWEALRSFSGFLDPEDGDAVRIQAGDAFREQLAVYNGTNFLVNDIVRLFDGVSGNYVEIGSIKTINIDNNTTDTVFSVNVAGSENWVIPYSIFRGSTKETGQLFLTSDGTTASVSATGAYLGSTGVTFNATVALGVLTLEYTSDNSGTGTLKLFTQRWSNAPGGPTGVPSYSTGGGGGGSAGGANQDVQFNNAGTLDGDARFKWDSATGSLNLNGLLHSVLTGPVTLLDNQITPATAISYNAATFRFAVIEYSIERNGVFRVGHILVPNDGTNAAAQDSSTEVGGSSGIVWSATISAGNVLVQYTSTNIGFNGTLKYTIKRWS